MYEYEAIRERIRERGERYIQEAAAERIAREARGQRRRRRRRYAIRGAIGIRRARGQEAA